MRSIHIILSWVVIFTLLQFCLIRYMFQVSKQSEDWKGMYEMLRRDMDTSNREMRKKWKNEVSQQKKEKIDEFEKLKIELDIIKKNMNSMNNENNLESESEKTKEENSIVETMKEKIDEYENLKKELAYIKKEFEIMKKNNPQTSEIGLTNEETTKKNDINNMADNEKDIKTEKRKVDIDEKLNIVVLYADDWRYDTLAAAGNRVIKTPYLDRMAKEGMLFTHNCVTTSVCWISRATLQTGQYLSRHKSNVPQKPEFLKKWNETFSSLLKENGYYTGFVGKWNFYEDPPEDGFDVFKQYYGWHYDEARQIHITQENENDALEFLKNRETEKPFALTVAFFATHAMDGTDYQFQPQNTSMSLYKDDVIDVPVSATEESWLRLPDFFSEANEGRIRWHWRFDSPEKYQTIMKNYFRMASEVDATCGRIIQELKSKCAG